MKVWIVQIGEPVPSHSDRSHRKMRMSMLGEALAQRGHHVTWWSTTFDHFKKRYRYQSDAHYEIAPTFQIRFIHSQLRYKSNASVSRFLNYAHIARRFSQLAQSAEEPDLILAGMPTAELCQAVTRYAQPRNIPTIIDIRDLWPEDIEQLFPPFLRPIAHLGLYPMRKALQEACTNATAITGTSESFVNWGANKGRRLPRKEDVAFPLAYPQSSISKEAEQEAMTYWNARDLIPEKNVLVITYLGAIGRNCNLSPVIQAAKRLIGNAPNIRFVICGDGDCLDRYKEEADGVSNMLFTGWIQRHQIQVLLKLTSVGIIPVQNIFSYQSNLPNKCLEYLSSGLPILSGLRGEVEKLVNEQSIGLVYDDQDTQDLCEKIRYLNDHSQVLGQMSRNAIRLHNERFDPEIVYAQFADYLENIHRLRPRFSQCKAAI